MAAEATIAIKALDLTRRVFLQVQNSLEKLKAQVGKAGLVIGGLFTLGLAKRGATEFIRAMREVEAESEKFGLSKEQVDKVTRATGALDALMNRVKLGVAGVVNGIVGLKDAMTGVKEDSASIAETIRVDRDLPKIKELNKEIEDLVRELGAVGETPAEHFARLADEIERVNEQASDPALSEQLNTLMREKEIAKLGIEQKKIATKVYEDFQQSVEDVNAAYADFVMKGMSVEDQQIVITSGIIRLTKAIDALRDSVPDDLDLDLATPEQIQNLGELTKMQKELIGLIGQREVLETSMQRIARQSGEIISQSLEDAIFAGNKLREVLKGLAQDLLRMAFREAVTAPLGAGLGGFFKNLFRAEGGPVGAGNPYIVGERGPELFVPRNSGSIISNDRLAGASGGGGGVNITYNIAAGVSRAELAPILEMERRRLKAEIPDMVRRGGAYRTAFA